MTNDTMRVAMYYNNSDIRLEELPVPAIGAGEVLPLPITFPAIVVNQCRTGNLQTAR